MKRFLAFALALTVAIPALAAAETSSWTIDPAHSSSQFSVRHLVISTVRGQFGKTIGTIKLDEKDLTRSSVEATVDVNTIDTRVAARDADLRSPNFFDTARYPTMTFKSNKVEKAGEDKLKVSGDLTIHGTTRPTVWDVTYSPQTKGMMGEMRRGFAAGIRINRKEFGLIYSKAIEAGPVVGDEVTITIDAEAIKDQPK
jgi:polyisoprenoid-binding protein YceI